MAQNDFAVCPGLRGKIVLITEGASSIGAELVLQFAQQGVRVACRDFHIAYGTAHTAQTGTTFLPCDLRDIAALRAAMKKFKRASVVRTWW